MKPPAPVTRTRVLRTEKPPKEQRIRSLWVKTELQEHARYLNSLPVQSATTPIVATRAVIAYIRIGSLGIGFPLDPGIHSVECLGDSSLQARLESSCEVKSSTKAFHFVSALSEHGVCRQVTVSLVNAAHREHGAGAEPAFYEFTVSTHWFRAKSDEVCSSQLKRVNRDGLALGIAFGNLFDGNGLAGTR